MKYLFICIINSNKYYASSYIDITKKEDLTDRVHDMGTRTPVNDGMLCAHLQQRRQQICKSSGYPSPPPPLFAHTHTHTHTHTASPCPSLGWTLRTQVSTLLQLSEGHWQQYYQERRSLDHRYQQASKQAGDKENQAGPAAWQEDFPLPNLPAICTESYADQSGRPRPRSWWSSRSR